MDVTTLQSKTRWHLRPILDLTDPSKPITFLLIGKYGSNFKISSVLPLFEINTNTSLSLTLPRSP